MTRPLFFEPRILIVEDEPIVARLMTEILAFGGLYDVESQTDPEQAIDSFDHFKPDLVILDLGMTPVGGLEVLAQLIPRIAPGEYLPILIVTGDISQEAKANALSAGAMDFLTKPFNAIEAVLRVKNLLRTRQLYLELQHERDVLEERVRERTDELQEARNEVLERLGFLAEFRDDATGQHTQRVAEMVRQIALEMNLATDEAELMGKAALLHDIGKVAIPDLILLKPGGLTNQEFSRMKLHAQIGGDILKGSKSSLLQRAELIARFHHEWWNGTGYQTLEGTDIPLAARITAVSDVYDALMSDRPYKRAWKKETALAEMRRLSGTHFDPNVVEAFFRVVNGPFAA